MASRVLEVTPLACLNQLVKRFDLLLAPTVVSSILVLIQSEGLQSHVKRYAFRNGVLDRGILVCGAGGSLIIADPILKEHEVLLPLPGRDNIFGFSIFGILAIIPDA